MLVIRLLRTGKKNQPSFKVVVTEKRNPPRGGRFIEQVGTYNPLTKERALNKERIQYWMSKGAQPSDTVYNMLVKNGVLEGSKIPVHKKSKKKEEKPKEEPPKEEAPKEEKPKEAPKQEEAKPEEKKEEPAEEEKKEEPSKEEKVEQKPEEKPKEEKKEKSPKEEEKKEEK